MMEPFLTAAVNGWPAVRQAVLSRDGGCVAAQMGAPELCRDKWGNVIPYNALDLLELDHVPLHARFRKAPDDVAHLQAVCPLHHSVWATKHLNREFSRTRLARMYPAQWQERDRWD